MIRPNVTELVRSGNRVEQPVNGPVRIADDRADRGARACRIERQVALKGGAALQAIAAGHLDQGPRYGQIPVEIPIPRHLGSETRGTPA